MQAFAHASVPIGQPAVRTLDRPEPEQPKPRRLEAVWARHEDDVRAAQALRWRVFALEMGATLTPMPGTPPGLDVDRFDAACEHLLVRTVETGASSSEVVGTYRVLTPAAARRLGGLYTDEEFDLAPLEPLRPRLAELGRSCTDPAWRGGSVILMLWASLARFLHDNRLEHMVGCASVSMADGGRHAARLGRQLATACPARTDLRVTPRLPLPIEAMSAGDDGPAVEPPPLIKGYLACGARLLGPPAWDPAFGCADLPLMLSMTDIPPPYRRRFLGA